MTFSSGVECSIWLPPLVSFCISFFTSMGGISGAFLLLPFSMNILGFTSPAVSPTNMVYNIVSIPSGVWRFVREGRMLWPLTWVVVVGTLPGVIVGGWIRLVYLPDPKPFKAFVGCVLLYIGARMFMDLLGKAKSKPAAGQSADPNDFRVNNLKLTAKSLSFTFQGHDYSTSWIGIAVLSLVVGVIGGIYGIGGGAILAPFFVAISHLPVYAVAGAALMGTFVTSIAGVLFYQLVAPYYESSGMAVSPDWLLGFLFGIGGFAGMYLGARTQKYVPAKWIKLGLAIIVTFVALRYIVGYLI